MLKVGVVFMTVVLGLILTPSLSAFAEQNISVSKQRPQMEQIKSKAQAIAEAAQQKRMADLKIYLAAKENMQDIRELAKPKLTLADKILMQYKMQDQAEQQRQMLVKILTENYKKKLSEYKQIQKLMNSDDVSDHGKKSIEYGKTLDDIKN